MIPSCNSVNPICPDSLAVRPFRFTASLLQGESGLSSTATMKIKHGHRRRGNTSKTYECWHSMTQRCRDPKATGFHRYGGRGITVCERWTQFENFLADMGEVPKVFTIERKDTNGNYDPDNCKWLPRNQQAKNTRRTVLFTLNGKTQTQSDWEREIGLSRGVIRQRLSWGWTVEQALQKTLPHRKEKGV